MGMITEIRKNLNAIDIKTPFYECLIYYKLFRSEKKYDLQFLIYLYIFRQNMKLTSLKFLNIFYFNVIFLSFP